MIYLVGVWDYHEQETILDEFSTMEEARAYADSWAKGDNMVYIYEVANKIAVLE